MTCKVCGMPRSPHNYRHVYVPSGPEKRFWAEWDDTGTVVVWANGFKYKMTVAETESLVADLQAAIRLDEDGL